MDPEDSQWMSRNIFLRISTHGSTKEDVKFRLRLLRDAGLLEIDAVVASNVVMECASASHASTIRSSLEAYSALVELHQAGCIDCDLPEIVSEVVVRWETGSVGEKMMPWLKRVETGE